MNFVLNTRWPTLVAAAVLLGAVQHTMAASSISPVARVYAAGSAVQSDFNPLGGYDLFTTRAASRDAIQHLTSSTYWYSADAAVYAGSGIEPMVFTQVEAGWDGQPVGAGSYAEAEVRWPHWIEALPGAPAGAIIPTILDFRVGQSETHGVAYAEMSFTSCWSGTCANPNVALTWQISNGTRTSTKYNWMTARYEAVPYVDQWSLRFDLSTGTGVEQVIRLRARSTYNTIGANSSSAQSIIDPLLMIDPSWEYASFFRVVQRNSLSDSTGVPVTRDWMPSPVPEPATTAMMLAAIPLLWGVACRRRRARSG